MKKLLILLLILSFSHTFSQENVCVGNGASATIHSSLIVDGSYIIDYNLSGANTIGLTSIKIDFKSGVGILNLTSSQLSNLGLTTLNVFSISNSVTSCVSVFPVPLTKIFMVNPLPNLSGTNIVNVVSPLCPFDDQTITLKSSLLFDGIYTVTYSLSGANTLASSTSSVTFISGIGIFSVPASQIPNVGTTNISVSALANSTSGCGSTYGTAVTGSFVINDYQNSLVSTEYEFCTEESKKLKDLSVLSIKWFDSDYVEIPGETIIKTGVYYYQNININNCFSPKFNMVTAVVNNCVDLIPTAFSPNGDGVNDTYNLLNIPYHFPNYEMTFLNRYGKLVYKGQNGWNGSYLNKGEILENGIYYMYLNYNDSTKVNSEHTVLIQK